MKALDTVMSPDELLALCQKYQLVEITAKKVAEMQAEISFKAGRQQGYDKGVSAGINQGISACVASPENAVQHLLDEARQAGIKEVVELGIPVSIDKRGAIPHFHYLGTDKGLVEYDMASSFIDQTGIIVFIGQAKLKEWGLDYH